MVSEQKTDFNGIYVTFLGERYGLHAKREIYVNQLGGKTRLLHRELWVERNGAIPKGQVVASLDGDKHDFSASNWVCRTKKEQAISNAKSRDTNQKIVFKGDNYFIDPRTSYFYSKYVTDEGEKVYKILHREIYSHHNGEIPEGYVIHHVDFDPSNNDSTNLLALTQSAHITLHNVARRKAREAAAKNL